MRLASNRCIGCGQLFGDEDQEIEHIRTCPKLLHAEPAASLVRVMTDEEYEAEAEVQKTIPPYNSLNTGTTITLASLRPRISPLFHRFWED